MKIRKNMISALAGAVLLFALVLPRPAPAEDDTRKGLSGEAFTDPSYRFPMPEDWLKKPVQYEKFSEQADLAVTLEQDVYYLIVPLIRKYAKEQGLKIAVQDGTCGISAGALARKTVDIGGFCCPPGKEDRLPGLKFHTLGIVAKAILVHPDNPVENVSAKQAIDIFSGRIYRWSELTTPSGKPGPDWKIRAIGRLHCKARPGHWRLLLGNEELFSPRMYEVGSIPDMIAGVAKHRDAVGWEVMGMAEKFKSLGRVRPLKIDGGLPLDIDALASGMYPYYRTYNVTTWEGKGVENPHAKGLVKYLLKEVEGIDRRYGFVSASRLRETGWKFKDDELIGESR